MTYDDLALTRREPRRGDHFGLERAIVRALVWELLADGTRARSPAGMFTSVCEVMATHLSLASASFFSRIAGQSRIFVWSAPDATVASRALAAAHAARCAVGPLDTAPAEAGSNTSSIVVSEAHMGLSAVLYVESSHAVDRGDQALLDDVLRRMLGLLIVPNF